MAKFTDTPSALAEMVKGARYLPEPDTRPLADLVIDAQDELKKSRSQSSDDLLKSVSPQLRGMVEMMGNTQGITQQIQDLQKTVADLTKTEFTTTYPLSGSAGGAGFAVYDLQAPAKKIFPVLTPIRNRIPRTPGQGSAVNWKQVTAISGSGGSQATANHFLAELPSNTVGGLTLNLPPEITFESSDKTQAYKPQGLSGSNSMISQIAGRGFQDIRELVGLSVLQSLMLSEERGLISGRTVAVAAPTIVSSVSAAPTAGQAGLTGVTTNLYIQVTALTMMGESLPSGTTTTATSNGNVVTVTIGTVVGAEAYRVYVGTGGADPGVAAHFTAGETGYNVFAIQGAVPTSGATPPAGDSTASANAYPGIMQQIEGAGANTYVKSLNGAMTLAALQGAFQDRYDVIKADVEEIWMAAGDRRSFSDLVLQQSGAAAQGFRINLTPGDNGVVGGVIVAAMLNESTNREVPLRVHPWLHTGNILGLSYTLPFANSEVPNVWEVKLPQDYMAIDWPVIDMNYRTSVILYGALVGFAPAYNFWIKGVQSANATATRQ